MRRSACKEWGEEGLDESEKKGKDMHEEDEKGG